MLYIYYFLLCIGGEGVEHDTNCARGSIDYS